MELADNYFDLRNIINFHALFGNGFFGTILNAYTATLRGEERLLDCIDK